MPKCVGATFGYLVEKHRIPFRVASIKIKIETGLFKQPQLAATQ